MKIKIDLQNQFPSAQSTQGDFDLYLNGFNNCETIKYGKELSGQTAILKSLCEVSKNTNKPIITAFDTDNYGILKQSVGVFENGKLLGITDMSIALSDNGYMPGASSKLYDLSSCKLGVLVGDDVYSFELFKSLAVCGAEIIVALSNLKKKEINSILIRAYSFLLGLPIVLVYKNGCYVSNVKGELVSPCENEVYEVEPYTDFILKTTKIRLKR